MPRAHGGEEGSRGPVPWCSRRRVAPGRKDLRSGGFRDANAGSAPRPFSCGLTATGATLGIRAVLFKSRQPSRRCPCYPAVPGPSRLPPPLSAPHSPPHRGLGRPYVATPAAAEASNSLRSVRSCWRHAAGRTGRACRRQAAGRSRCACRAASFSGAVKRKYTSNSGSSQPRKLIQ